MIFVIRKRGEYREKNEMNKMEYKKYDEEKHDLNMIKENIIE